MPWLTEKKRKVLTWWLIQSLRTLNFWGRPLVFQFVADREDMPRKARIDAAGTLHHIMGRGIDRSVIFRNSRDRDDIHPPSLCHSPRDTHPLLCLGALAHHVHLLLKTGFVPIAHLMRRLLTGYAVSHNRRHGRTGHLFQNRYTSILCDEESYCLELLPPPEGSRCHYRHAHSACV